MFKVGHEQEEITLCARFDVDDKRAHYVLMPITKEDDWLFYKELVKGSQVRCDEVFVDVCGRGVDIASLGEDGDDDPIEHVTQEDIHACNEDDDGEDDELSDDDAKVEDEEASGDEGDFDICRVANNFDDDTFENEEVDDDDMLESSDEDPYDDGGVGCEQENVVRQVPLAQPTPMIEEVRFVEPISFRQPTPVVEERVEETLEAAHIQVPEVPIFYSIPSKAYCDSGLRLGSIEPDSGEELIAKGMILTALKSSNSF
ncbi:unnamed protein product [Urochloa decumbens]|uniref:Uncharacterized protein n=1 Tax=Urochloa decumbens TaxID=240449 RepID=A0ABC9DAN5_9POAL